MKAVICTKYGSSEVLEIGEVAKPIPKKNEICIKIHATSVTASDCIIRGFNVSSKHRIPMGLAIGFKKPRKAILGMVYAGEVESIGRKVKLYKKGDQVFGFDRYGFGAYAQYKCVSENGLLVKKPASIDYRDAAALPYGGLLALYFLRKANIERGQRVLIYGASGAVGTSAIQLATYMGAEVTGVCSTANLDLVKSLGAHRALDYTKDDFSLGNGEYDLIFNAVGKKKVKVNCENALTKNGKHITVDDGSPKSHIDDLIFLSELMDTGQLKAVIDRCYPLEQMIEAHRYVDKGHKKGNVIITIGHSK